MSGRLWIIVAAVVATAAAAIGSAGIQLAERPLSAPLTDPAIEYDTRPTHDLVNALKRRIENLPLTFDADTGYLRSVLQALRVPVESQMLVMSKTGVQGLDTGPENPRAIYFNDAVAVGYIRGASLLEIAAHDPEQGIIFYTIDQKPPALSERSESKGPSIERRSGCVTSCHKALSTLHVPGLMARSVAIGPDGSARGSFTRDDPDDRTPFRQRWGGWYVSGATGTMTHRGNTAVQFDSRGYLSAKSDVAALMVFQHQVHMTNLLTRIGWDARLGVPLQDAAVEFVDYLLFVDEEPLTARIAGTSGFAEAFSAQGPFDRNGRSLRQLDLERRLLRYPCSYMIYSPAFAALLPAARTSIYDRMWSVLSGREAASKYARLSAEDRRALLEILGDTLPDWPAAWRP